MSTVRPRGLHHVTAIATDPQANVDFYTQSLGLRLVKQTVNFDSPDSYHLYYGDEPGSPSSLLTFFPWPGVPQGRHGAGMMTSTAFSVPGESLGWWHERLKAFEVDVDPPRSRDAEDVLTFRDPDGMVIDLVASTATIAPAGTAWPTSRPSTRSVGCTRSRCPSAISTRRPPC